MAQKLPADDSSVPPRNPGPTEDRGQQSGCGGTSSGTGETKEPPLDRLIALVLHQDSVLQAYRGIFVASQSILVSVAALMIQFKAPVLFFALFFGGMFVLGIWYFVTKWRGEDVHFLVWVIREIEGGQLTITKPFSVMEEFRARRLFGGRPVSELPGYATTVADDKRSRWSMQFGLMGIFVMLWLVLFGWELFLMLHQQAGSLLFE